MHYGAAADCIVDSGTFVEFLRTERNRSITGNRDPQGAGVTAPVFSAVHGGNQGLGRHTSQWRRSHSSRCPWEGER